MKKHILFYILALAPTFLWGQFTPTSEDKGLTIIVTDGTGNRRSAPLRPKGSGDSSGPEFRDPIVPLGMSEAIQAGAFLERPQYGVKGFFLIFCVGDSIGGKQGVLEAQGQRYTGVYRLIRQKFSKEEEIPEGMRPFRLFGTIFILGVSY